MPSVVAACVVAQLRPDPGAIGTTGIDKRPVDGPVRVGRYGLYADVQADRKYHGGLGKAVYVYAQEDADWWSAELGRDIPPGLFGENLRLEGIDVMAARVGERWRVGSVELEVTEPRTPCQTFARWLGGDIERGWVKRFSDERRLGTYLSVASTGRLAAGDDVVVLSRPAGAPTVSDIYAGV